MGDPQQEFQPFGIRLQGHELLRPFGCGPSRPGRRPADAARPGIGKPLSITSGFRCNRHNKAVGGAEQSFHTLGMAADVSCPAGVSPEELAVIAEEIPLFCEGGIGV